MTIYEQIERAVELVERRLADTERTVGADAGISHAEGALAAGMGERSFRTWFQAVTGHSWREYVLRRRLAKAALLLTATDRPILEIALDSLYGSHEAFTRSFTREFTLPPRAYRERGGAMDPALPARLEKIKLYREMYMGVIVKELKEMRAAFFDGFQPNPEDKAKSLLNRWRSERPAKAPRRVFGHNINADGSVARTPDYAGYRFYCVLAEGEADGGAPVTTIEAGTFVVTGIEGNFKTDPSGAWIGAGWERMNAMVREKGYRVKTGARWFEEELEPSAPGNLRLDLYLEIEGGSPR